MVNATASCPPRQRKKPLFEIPMPRIWLEEYTSALGIGVLTINHVRYGFHIRYDADRHFCSATLIRDDNGTSKQYLVTSAAGKIACNCPDGTYRAERPGGCKHVYSLRRLALTDSHDQSDHVCEHDHREAAEGG